jgi:hypothetical protein
MNITIKIWGISTAIYSNFCIKLSKEGNMTQVHCDRKHCLNNDKYGICTADAIEYNGLCQTYITAKHSCKPHCGICRKDKGKLKRKGGEVLK